MTGNYASIEHEGIVKSSDHKSVKVSITSSSACSGCHAESICSLYGNEQRIVEVPGDYNVAPGESVKVIMKQSSGYKAVLLGYVLPLILVIMVLILLAAFSFPELTAGLASISILIPYYTLLYLLKKRINRKFTFMLKGL